MFNHRIFTLITVAILMTAALFMQVLITARNPIVFAQSGNDSAQITHLNAGARVTLTPTKKPTNTRTSTRKPSPTRTKTATSTRTKIRTITRTKTRTVTRTKTSAPTNTKTLTPTSTKTTTPTNTAVSSAPQPYLEYQIYGGTVITDSTMPPVLANGEADYAEIFAEHNLCALIASGQVDEVWIWAGNGDGITKGNMHEWTTSGGEWAGAAPNCGKMVTTLTFNYLRDVDEALESYTHRLEGLFGHYFTCDFSTATWPWAGSTTWPYSQCGTLLSDRYGFVARPSANNNQMAGCGDAHHPPNILDNREYIYDDTTTVETICPSWSEDGSALATSLNCNAWGCTHWNFFIWWMQNIPGLDNINKDRNGSPQPNWWSYMFGAPPASLANKTNTTKNIASQFSMPLTSQPAVTTRRVYVIYYPGYGDTPRADVNVLTTELIGLLKEGTTYHGYEYSGLHANFLGQDGKSYAGQGCGSGTVADNIHIHLEGLKTDIPASGYHVQDSGGLWATPCNPVSNWLLYVIADSPAPGQADLYFKPYRTAPDGTMYTVTIEYGDGTNKTVAVAGTQVQP